MASSIKALLRSKTNKKGQHPLVVRITKDRKSTFIYTGYYLEKKFWDEKNQKVKKSYPNANRLNNFIAKRLAEAYKTLLELENQNKIVSSEKVKEELVNPISGKTFNEISSLYLSELKKNQKISRYKTDKVRINHFINYCESENILFQEITENKLRQFMSYLEMTKKVSKRSVINNLVVIRTLYNRAIKMGVIDRKLYPFGSDKIRIKFPETEKIGLSEEEVLKIENITELTPEENHTRNIWLFSFYLAGMRVGDVLKIRWSDIHDNRLYYRMSKNAKLLSLKLPKKILPILEQYSSNQENADEFIFPEMKFANMESATDILAKTNNATKKFNKYLSRIAQKTKIKKKLTMHIARHSFGNIAGDKIHPLMLQKLYRHSDLKTTLNYQANFIHKEADEALDSVINF